MVLQQVLWLKKFKMHHGITCQVASGELRDVPAHSVVVWNKILPSYFKLVYQEYQFKDIFNADKMGLFYHLMLNWTLVYKSEKCKGRGKKEVKIALLYSFV